MQKLHDWQVADVIGNQMAEYICQGYKKSKVRKLTLISMKVLYSMFSTMREDKASSIYITDLDETLDLTPYAMALCLIYEEGLKLNLKGIKLLNFIQDEAISYFDPLLKQIRIPV